MSLKFNDIILGNNNQVFKQLSFRIDDKKTYIWNLMYATVAALAVNGTHGKPKAHFMAQRQIL